MESRGMTISLFILWPLESRGLTFRQKPCVRQSRMPSIIACDRIVNNCTQPTNPMWLIKSAFLLLWVSAHYQCMSLNNECYMKQTKSLLSLSIHVLHFFKLCPNTFIIFVTHFFCSLNVKESKKKYHAPVPWTTTSK